MGTIQKLFRAWNKSTAEPATIADVEAALRALVEERDRAQAAIEATAVRRRALLLVDGSDAEIAELDSEADRHRLALERCDAIEPKLFSRIDELRSVERRVRWQDLQNRYHPAMAEFIASWRAACDSFDRVLAIQNEARGKGYDAEANAAWLPLVALLPLQDRLTVDRYEADAERLREATRPTPAQAKEVQQPLPPKIIKPAKVQTSPLRNLALQAGDPIARRAVNFREPIVVEGDPPPGMARIRLLRPGVEIDEIQRIVGDELFVPKEQAWALAHNTAAEIVACDVEPPKLTSEEDGAHV